VTEHLQAIITLLSLVNPFMCAAIFAQIEAGLSSGTQMRSAAKVALAVFVILTVAALLGVKMLHLFGVSLDAFMVAGGGVLAWLGFSMLCGLPPGPPATSTTGATPSLTPLILFAASPGTITGVITLSVAHAKSGIPVTALVAVTVATAVMWLLIVLVARLGRSSSGGFVHDTVTRFMGLIVIAMGVQFALSGVRSFMLEPDHAAPRPGANAAGVTQNACCGPSDCKQFCRVDSEQETVDGQSGKTTPMLICSDRENS
jgi:small neutral amino acid transporter SnatA (MarC family)